MAFAIAPHPIVNDAVSSTGAHAAWQQLDRHSRRDIITSRKMSYKPFEEAYRALLATSGSVPSRYPSILSALQGAPSAWAPPLPWQEYLKNIIAGDDNKTADPLSFLRAAAAAKPRIFVSYHHRGDRPYYDEFCRSFAELYEVCHDNSIGRVIDSDDPEYVMRRIREDYLTGTSCTVVLCGAQTPWRKFVDWEIKATLDKQHGLLGVMLPSNHPNIFGCRYIPDRLKENIDG